MNTIFLALGSNVGDRLANFEQAIQLLSEHVHEISRAQVYETLPVGYLEQDNFLNSAVKGMTDLNPGDLLRFVKEIEKKVGRIKRFQNGPREIDIDILFYDDMVIGDEQNGLLPQIPHPRLQDRDFVLRPLMDLAPDLVHPVLKKTVRELLNELPEENKSVLNPVTS